MKKLLIFLLICTSSSLQPNLLRGLFRLTFTNNFHEVEPGVLYRSAALSASRLAKKIRTHNIKTVINLRGAHPHKKWWRKENELLTRLSIRFYNIALDGRKLPPPEAITLLLKTFKTAPQPLLIHCQAGAERTGLAIALWHITQRGMTKKEALRSLSDDFGHFSSLFPLMRFFIKILPDDPAKIQPWLISSYPADYRRLSSSKTGLQQAKA